MLRTCAFICRCMCAFVCAAKRKTDINSHWCQSHLLKLTVEHDCVCLCDSEVVVSFTSVVLFFYWWSCYVFFSWGTIGGPGSLVADQTWPSPPTTKLLFRDLVIHFTELCPNHQQHHQIISNNTLSVYQNVKILCDEMQSVINCSQSEENVDELLAICLYNPCIFMTFMLLP